MVYSVYCNHSRSDLVNQWPTQQHALDYLARADRIPHRTEGEAELLRQVPTTVRRILDLGTGDGRLLSLLKIDRPDAKSVALDFSPTMLEAVRDRFAQDATVQVLDHNLDDPLPDLGTFDAIVSSFAIHHVTHERKRSLYQEIFEKLDSGGVFCNLEHVASPTPELHRRFLSIIGYSPETEDPSNQLLDVEAQLQWLRSIGFQQVDCYWKWLEMALLIGIKP
ncbi:MAG: class I SAM-dependent methyltransferase [Acaryochloridaceae cyanobacterium RU_4_10]|nr:class I SAM-dependent methyltransferase [Acaryochloridaceae cyanobacterium RU_4_10]